MAAPRDPTSLKYQHHLSEIKVGSHVEFVVECKYVFTFLILYHLLERATKKSLISHAEIVLFVLVLFIFGAFKVPANFKYAKLEYHCMINMSDCFNYMICFMKLIFNIFLMKARGTTVPASDI